MTEKQYSILELVSLFLGVLTLVSIIIVNDLPGKNTYVRTSIPFIVYVFYIISLILDFKYSKEIKVWNHHFYSL